MGWKADASGSNNTTVLFVKRSFFSAEPPLRSTPGKPAAIVHAVAETKRPRMSHGERTRNDILDVAEGLATREGLASLSIARLAEEVGMSKGGVFAHFGSKEALQLATLAAARERFMKEVAEPALRAQPGLEQLRVALDSSFEYVAKRLQHGGCFFTATTLEMADRPGAVRDQVSELLQARHAMIAGNLREAIRKKEIVRGTDTEQVAFELISLATGAMVELQMFKSEKTLQRVRDAVARRISELTAPQVTTGTKARAAR
jgi:AcrR family transcriptional regulator